MAKILLDYAFPIEVIEQMASVDTGFLRKVAVVVKPDGSQPDFVRLTNKTQIATYTQNDEVKRLFEAGLNEVFLILKNDLEIDTVLDRENGKFYTLLISGDFDKTDIEGIITTPEVKSTLKEGDILFTSKLDGTLGDSITVELVDDHTDGSAHVTVVGQDISIGIQAGVTTAQTIQDAIQDSVSANALVYLTIDIGQENNPQGAFSQDNLAGGVDEVVSGDRLELGTFQGVTGVSSNDDVFLKRMASMSNRVGFYTDQPNDSESMLHAFGKFLSSIRWRNQQYIEMLKDELINDLGLAEGLFSDRISFVLTDDDLGPRLGLFAVGGRAIISPYIIKEISMKLQFETVSWINFNNPQYTVKEASLLESYLQEKVIDSYIDQGLISEGDISIALLESNFVANGTIDIPSPTALWRIKSEMRISN